MARRDDLQTMVGDYLAGDYTKTKPRTVPLPEDVPLGKSAALLEATALFVDLRQSSDITNAFRRQTAAKMLKSYFHGAVKIVRAQDGVVRSFNGDGLLALFIGDERADDAVRAAMEMKWFIEEILWTRFDRYFTADAVSRGAPLKFSVGCGIDDGHIYGCASVSVGPTTSPGSAGARTPRPSSPAPSTTPRTSGSRAKRSSSSPTTARREIMAGPCGPPSGAASSVE